MSGGDVKISKVAFGFKRRTKIFSRGKAWVILPHDGAHGDKFFATSYESAIREAGFDVLVIPNQGAGAASARIETARRHFPRMFFNEETTEGGRDAIGWYHEKKSNDDRNIGLGPNHYWSSHGADSFGLMCIQYDRRTALRRLVNDIAASELARAAVLGRACGSGSFTSAFMVRTFLISREGLFDSDVHHFWLICSGIGSIILKWGDVMRIFLLLSAAVSFWLVLVFSQLLAHAETRAALVIGNSAYEHAPRLPNPVNDANDVGAALKRDGFETIVATDLSKAAMEEATIRFAKAARDADVAVFYYSGHALQFAGVNYLAPVDADLKDETDLRRMVRLDDVVVDLQRAKSLRILVLDSCRDNPLAEKLKRSIGNSRAIPLQRGLAKIDTPQGMIVAYATQAGGTADDGDGRNSPYTTAFLKHIEKQEEIGTIFRRISGDVYESTQHRQLPELSLSIIGEFYLRGKLQISALPSDASLPPSAPETNFKYSFQGVINPPESRTYKVFVRDREKNIIARAGPSEREDGLFRLQPGDEVQATAKYDPDDTGGDADAKSWIKAISPLGEVGFVPGNRLFTPEEYGRYSEVLDRIKALRVLFDRAAKENSGPYASFSGVYCAGYLDCAGPPPELRSSMSTAMLTRYLIWFEGKKIHQVGILGAQEKIGEMQADKPVSFGGDKPPWKGVKNIPSFKITWNNGKSDLYAFNNTHLFFQWAEKGKGSFGVTGKGRSTQYQEMQITNDYMLVVAEQHARHGGRR